MVPMLEVKNLVKKYQAVDAVDDISFSIPRGICFGLLGPNGAGKTTALEVIEDIIPPTSGQILYNGAPRTSFFREEVGIQFQHTTLLNFMSVRETLATFKNLYQKTESIEHLVDICKLEDIQHQMNNKISGGQAQRLMLALALINKPRLLFLDEPSTGLDPQARRYLWQIIRGILEDGKTIVLTTHSMDEAEYLCDEIAIMDHGKIIAEGSPPELIERYCEGGTISLPRDNVQDLPAELPYSFREANGRIEIMPDKISTGIEKLLAIGIDLSGMTVHSPNLEDVFLNLTGRTLRE
ncbi:MAG: ABC transporter ATP-binding protein [Desulfobulbaceae bacterium]|nr:ABC transporter ATP-binding protein [Desulfobulbaceae bacterium]